MKAAVKTEHNFIDCKTQTLISETAKEMLYLLICVL